MTDSSHCSAFILDHGVRIDCMRLPDHRGDHRAGWHEWAGPDKDPLPHVTAAEPKVMTDNRRHAKMGDDWHRLQLEVWEANETEAWGARPTDGDTRVHRYRALLLRWAIDQLETEGPLISDSSR